jgi:hypothetical protein
MDLAITAQLKTSSGSIPISTPEMTAYDLVRYRKRAGSIDHTATVLAELAEHMDARRLLSIAEMGEEVPVIKRLGYLLERTGHGELAAGRGYTPGASFKKRLPGCTPYQHGHLSIHVVDDPHLPLPRVQPVQPPRVLHERSLPRHRHRQEQRIQPAVVEPFSDVAACRQ